MGVPSKKDNNPLNVAVSSLIKPAYDSDYQTRYELACSLLEHVRNLVPDSGHNDSTQLSFNMRSCLGGMQNMILHNFLDTWLMAAPCDVKLGHYRHEFQQLQLNRWAHYIRGTGAEISGILKDTKYLFITWDLSNLESNEWNDRAIEQVGNMLMPLGEQTRKGLTIHRIIFVNLKSLEDNILTRRKFFLDIWNKYFYPFCAVGNKNYCVSFIDKNAYITALGMNKSRRLDVALFSKSDDVLKKVNDEVIPIADELCYGYDAAQYTARTDMTRYPNKLERVESPEGFLNLYVSETDPIDSECIASRIVTSWVRENKNSFKKWNESKSGLCDEDIRDNMSKVFVRELSQQNKDTFKEGIKFEPLFKS